MAAHNALHVHEQHYEVLLSSIELFARRFQEQAEEKRLVAQLTGIAAVGTVSVVCTCCGQKGHDESQCFKKHPNLLE